MRDGLFSIVATGLAGAWLLLFAGFVALVLRYARLRGEVDLFYATGALDADQASLLRGDIAIRRSVNSLLGAENRALRGTLTIALDEMARARREARILGETLDDALGVIGDQPAAAGGGVVMLPILGKIS